MVRLCMEYSIRMATPNDATHIVALMPRLADFNIPIIRKPEDLWHGDLKLVKQWAEGSRIDVDVCVAEASNKVVGVAVLTERSELLTGEPSAHLEILALDKSAEGFGIASALMAEVDVLAKARGAQTVTLHVFASNTKARALYERKGYDGELIRYIKPLV